MSKSFEQCDFDEAVKAFLPTMKDALNCPIQYLVDFALTLVNLKDKEKSVLIYVQKEGKTQEETAEIMAVDVKTVYNNLRTARKKVFYVWGNNNLIKFMAEESRKCK